MLRLVLPKGSLERATMQLFEDADLAVTRGSDVDYRGSIDDPRVDEVRILRPQEILRYVAENGVGAWAAVDDMPLSGLGEDAWRFVQTDGARGLDAWPVSRHARQRLDRRHGARAAHGELLIKEHVVALPAQLLLR